MDHVTITIDGQDGWTLRSGEIVESLCTPGAIVAEVEHDNANIDPADMIGTWASFDIPTLLESQPTRWAGGIITRWETIDAAISGERGTYFRFHAAAPMERMSLRRQTRQFNGESVLNVCRQILDEWGDRVPASMSGPLMVLDNEPCNVPIQHIRQTQETDLQFISRLFHMTGVFTANHCTGPNDTDTTLYTGTTSNAAHPWADDLELIYEPITGSAALDHQVTQWRRLANLVPQIPVVATWHPSAADNLMPSNPHAMKKSPSDPSFPGWEFVEHPLGRPHAGLMMSDLRDQLSHVREAALKQEHAWRHGQSTSSAIVPGHTIAPSDLPHDDNGPFFVTATRLIVMGEGLAPQVDLDSPVRCAFTALPASTSFRPPIRHERLEPPDLDNLPLSDAINTVAMQEIA
jgi:uncharacterized protein involved in type VI secretion and phage assembly